MNPAQLAALFAAHKTAILGGGAAAVAGLALLQKRKKATAATAGTTTTAGATVPAAAVVPTSTAGGGYDSSVTDLYSALQPELEALQAQGAGVTAPAASALLAPTSNNQWESQAVKGWVDAGQNPLDLQAALAQYVAGQPINTAQSQGISWAIKNYGTAPEGTTGVSRVVTA